MGDSALRGKYHDREPLAFRTSRKRRFYVCGPHVVRSYQKSTFFASRDFCVASADQHSKIYVRAPRSGNAATLPTHQVGSRHAGCATPGAFRHRKHAHERRARARLCQLIKTLGDTLARREVVLSCPCAPGAGAAVASTGWQSRLSSAVAVATRPTACCQDVPAARRVACQQCCRVHWTPIYGVLHVVPVCGLLNVVCMSFGRVVECGCAKCA